MSDVFDIGVLEGRLSPQQLCHARRLVKKPPPVYTGIVRAAHAGRLFRTRQTWNGKNVPDFSSRFRE